MAKISSGVITLSIFTKKPSEIMKTKLKEDATEIKNLELVFLRLCFWSSLGFLPSSRETLVDISLFKKPSDSSVRPDFKSCSLTQ